MDLPAAIVAASGIFAGAAATVAVVLKMIDVRHPIAPEPDAAAAAAAAAVAAAVASKVASAVAATEAASKVTIVMTEDRATIKAIGVLHDHLRADVDRNRIEAKEAHQRVGKRIDDMRDEILGHMGGGKS